MRGGAHLKADGCEIKVTGLPGFGDYPEFMALLMEHQAREADKKQALDAGASKEEVGELSGIQVQTREDGVYIVYPEVDQDIRRVDGVNLMCDRPEDPGKLNAGIRLQKEMEDMGVFPLTSANAMNISKDKVRSTKCFRSSDIPIPKGFEVERNSPFNEEHIRSLFADLQFPVMVKDALGSGANGVNAFEDLEEAMQEVRRLYDSYHSIDIQEKIPPLVEDKGRPHLLRIIVQNGEVVGAIKWLGEVGDTVLPMRKGKFTGAEATVFELSDEQKQIAVNTAKSCLQGLAGIDAMLVDGPDGKVDMSCLCVLETNSAPGFASFERYFGEVIPTIAENFIKMIAVDKEHKRQPVPRQR